MRKPVKSNERTARTEARLGIFWFVKGKLLIDSTPLSECEHYGDHLNYPGSHIDVWTHWQQIGKVPAESEYEEFARGRVMCDMKAKTFTRFVANRRPFTFEPIRQKKPFP